MKVQSPHLTIYKAQLSSMLSIFHRMTGAILGMDFIAIAPICVLYGTVLELHVLDSFLHYEIILQLGVGVVFVIVASLCYHLGNGIRHLVWDAGFSVSNEGVRKTAIFLFVGVTLLFVAVIGRLFF